MRWEQRAVCSQGHDNGPAPFGDLFHAHHEVCWVCAEPKEASRTGRFHNWNWRVRTQRWVHTPGRWPWQWWRGHMEVIT